MPTSTRRPPSRFASGGALTAALIVAVGAAAGGCARSQPSDGAAVDGLVALASGADGTSLVGWDAGGGDAIKITLPKGEATWVGTGRADVLAAVLGTATTATSDPVHLGKPLKWRTTKAVGPTGAAPKGPFYFATWDPEGGRFAMLAGDLSSGDEIRVVLIDPTVGTSFEIPIDHPVVAAPPVWIDDDRLVVVTGDAAGPLATIVDTTTSELDDGPAGARLLAASANGRRVATMAGQGAPVVIRDTAGWLAGDGSSVASIDPPSGRATAIGFALDAAGQRLAVAWATDAKTVSLAVHDERAGWRRLAQPEIGSARGAVVAWLR
jgi:hypothetical protein